MTPQSPDQSLTQLRELGFFTETVHRTLVEDRKIPWRLCDSKGKQVGEFCATEEEAWAQGQSLTPAPARINLTLDRLFAGHTHVVMTREELSQELTALTQSQKMTTQQLIEQLITEGGAIVSSNICSVLEIADAQATGRFAVDEEGMGFILRYKEWVEKAKNDHELLQSLPQSPAPSKELEERYKELADEYYAKLLEGIHHPRGLFIHLARKLAAELGEEREAERVVLVAQYRTNQKLLASEAMVETLKRELAEAKGELLTVGDDYREACNEIERHRAKLDDAEKIQATMEEAIAIKNKLYSDLCAQLANAEKTIAYQRGVIQHAAIRNEDQKSQLLTLSVASQRQRDALKNVHDATLLDTGDNSLANRALKIANEIAYAALAETPDVSLWKSIESAPKEMEELKARLAEQEVKDLGKFGIMAGFLKQRLIDLLSDFAAELGKEREAERAELKEERALHQQALRVQELRLAKTNLENQLSEARTIAKELEVERDALDEHHHRYVSANLQDRQRVLGDCDSLRTENATLKRRLDEAMNQYANDMAANEQQTQRLLNDIENLRAEIAERRARP